MEEVSYIGMIGEEITLERMKIELRNRERIRIYLASPGGDVFEGLAIYDFLLRKEKVEFVIEGMVGSVSTIITCAGTVKMGQGFYILHNPIESLLVGANKEKLEKGAEKLEKIENRFLNIYQKKTGLEKNKIYNLMKEEEWLDVDEAIEKGFVDEKIEYESKIAASIKFNLQAAGLKKRGMVAQSDIINPLNPIDPEDKGTQAKIEAYTHNSKTDKKNEPQWGEVDKKKLPPKAFVFEEKEFDPTKKTTWSYPHHWVKGGTQTNKKGVYTNGELLLSLDGLKYAWAAARGARTGEKASQVVFNHLEDHREKAGISKESCYAFFEKVTSQINNNNNQKTGENNMSDPNVNNGSQPNPQDVNLENIKAKLDPNQAEKVEALINNNQDLNNKVEAMSKQLEQINKNYKENQKQMKIQAKKSEIEKDYPNVQDSKGYAETLVNLEANMGEDSNEVKKVYEALKAMNTKAESVPGGMGEKGNGGTNEPQNAKEKIEQKVKALQKNENMNYHEAFVQACKENKKAAQELGYI